MRRHPHVFTPDGRPLAGTDITTAEVRRRWEDLKAEERARQGAHDRVGAARRAGVDAGAAARLRADGAGGRGRLRLDLARRRARQDRRGGARGARRASSGSAAAVEDEVGDLLFAIANYARKLGVEPEAALRGATRKFQERFTRMEELAREDGATLASLSLDAQNALWDRVKAEGGGAGH